MGGPGTTGPTAGDGPDVTDACSHFRKGMHETSVVSKILGEMMLLHLQSKQQWKSANFLPVRKYLKIMNYQRQGNLQHVRCYIPKP